MTSALRHRELDDRLTKLQRVVEEAMKENNSRIAKLYNSILSRVADLSNQLSACHAREGVPILNVPTSSFDITQKVGLPSKSRLQHDKTPKNRKKGKEQHEKMLSYNEVCGRV